MISDIFTLKKLLIITLLLIFAGIIFVFLHAYLHFDFLRFDKDRSLEELLEIFLLIAASLICSKVILSKISNPLFKSFGFIFAFTAFDDLFGIHEILGALLSYLQFVNLLAESFGTEAQEIGELLYFGTIGLFFLYLILKDSSYISLKMLPILCGIGLVLTGGVIIDFARSFEFFPEVKDIGFFEDFIEYLGINLIFLSTFYYTVEVFRKEKNVPIPK